MSVTSKQTAMNTVSPASLVIVDPLLRRLYQYWERERGGWPLPARDSIDPIKMRYILGHVALIDVKPGPQQFRIRLHGTELVSHLGADFTGKAVAEIPLADARKMALAWFTAVAEHGCAHHQQVDQVVDGFNRRFEALVLPYSASRGSGVDLLLLAIRCRTPASAGLMSRD